MDLFIMFSVCALLGAKILLLAKILWTKDCTGISGKTQLLYAIIFATRYIDVMLMYSPISVSLTKIGFMALTYCTVLSIFFFYFQSYQIKHDRFRIELLTLPCIVLSLLANNGFEIVEVFWAFSIYLESVAILPQAYMCSRIKHVENIVYYYMSILSVYKVFHLMDGIYRFYTNQQYDRITLAAGVVQLMFYCDFFLRDLPLKSELRLLEHANDASRQEVHVSVVDNKYLKEQEALRSAQQVATIADDDAKFNNLKEVVLTPNTLVKDDKVAMSLEQSGKETGESIVRV
ncbi:ER lumen protein-retaining receptor-like [Phymastichus coffea]|uniref:ER lumen protein-retaining receptor-like n=1 Tax=Phymastichus coffea TaxID=108790 RepID=UPI00273B504A|nr:ER lumen protein-retaining receptor-like [Phymastichus coffea]